MRFLLFTTWFLSFLSAFAQRGDYLLTHYKHNIPGVDHVNYDMAMDSNGLLSIANRSGLIQFDGKNWDYFSSPVALLSLDVNRENEIFVGGVNDYGYFGFDDKNYRFISLSSEETTDELFFETLTAGDKAYFLSQETVIVYEISEGIPVALKAPTNDLFTTIFELNNVIYVQSESSLFELSEDGLSESTLEIPDNAQVQFVSRRPGQEEHLLGTTLNQLFLVSDGSFKPLKASKEVSASGYYGYDGVWVSDKLVAISTLEAGCLVIDVEQDRLESKVNYESGLPDNEVLSMIGDYDHGLWVAHEYGLTRLVPEIPILSFSNYPGMTGNLLSLSTYHGKTYVSTSSGVYYFDQENRYRNKVYYTVERIGKKASKKTSTPKALAATKPAEDQKKRRKKVLGGLFKKKAKNEEKAQDSGEEKKGFFGRIVKKIEQQLAGEVKTIKGKPDKNTRYVRRVRRELISSRYLYRKVDGLDFKTKQLISFQGHLLAVSNSGLYEVKDSVANLIVDDIIKYAHATKEYLLLATVDNEVRVFELLEDLWIESQSFSFSGEIIVSIFSDDRDRIWIVSSNSIHQFDPLSLTQEGMIYAKIPNQFVDKVRGTVIDGRIYLVNSSGYFFLDEEEGVIKPDDLLMERLGKPLRHLQSKDGTVWVYNGQAWTSIGQELELKTYELLGIFPDLSFIDIKKDGIWLIDQNKELYQFEAKDSSALAFQNKTFIRNVKNNERRVQRSGDIDFSFDKNSITFELSRPDYLGISQVEYQYQLKGLMPDWSEWTSNEQVDFNYLPPGDYTLVARSRDVFGEVQDSGVFAFSIDPPYWQTSWFYAIQIIVFVSLVVASARLNRGENKGKYALLSQGLTLFTIILIIEFLQTVAGSSLDIESSPVVDFLIDATIALLIFPVEILLKRVIRSGAEVKSLKKIMRPG